MSIYMQVQDNREKLITSAKAHGIKSLKLFGSVAKGAEQKNSDIDLLVSFEEGRSLFDLIRFKQEVESLLGRDVDVVTENSIHSSIKEEILNEAISL
ncbi:nucleotidyltransferase family protein [Lentibacillus sediminis]|uniref:nucleotidyltransferase family protein n=1 Tax=Lentibacillus sediminis TaxID=1940529 RepID=UPI00195B112E|nr:nucleotidyltransferase family protein [Lentibacillus sediminis]